MIRFRGLLTAVLCSCAAMVAVAQAPSNAAPAGSAPPPRPAHSGDPVPTGGTKASPADPTAPPLTDPLKQQAVTDLPPSLATPAVQFITQASMDGLTEIEIAHVALQQSSASRVREFARRMVVEHQKINAKLDALASTRGTSLPRVLDSDHASSVDSLRGKTGKAFDSGYAAQMRLSHDRALELYGAASSLSDGEVARFAAAALPMLKAHRSQAEILEHRSSTPSH